MRYEVVGLLGRGGAAVVELAVDADGRRVATKRVTFTGSAAQIAMAHQRLRREAEVLSTLHHPAIVPILDVVEEGGGEGEIVLVFPAMAENLEDRVERLGLLPPTEVARIGEALLGAVAEAHRHGVVHRDIKPANVLFDESARPALSDFGVAATSELTFGLTPIGTVVGTPTWMAPEQARGGQSSPASDVFSLAATLAFAMTGQGPYGSGPPEAIMTRAARGEILSLPASIPDTLRGPLRAMLDPSPERRPSAAAALGGLDGTRFVPVVDPGRSERKRRSRTHPYRIASVALATVALAAGSLAAMAATDQRSRPPAAHTLPAPTTPPAPHTNGKTCLPGWYDLDQVAANGCESTSDYVAGVALVANVPVRANIVPLSATDTYTTQVKGDSLHLCWGSLHVTLTAPPQTAEQLTVWKGSTEVGRTVSTGGNAATVTLNKPSCFGADSERLRVSVSVEAATGAASARDFTLTRDAGW
jgi:serine/threonine protein kinase